MPSDPSIIPNLSSFDDVEVTVKIALPSTREDRSEKVPTLKVVAGPGQDMLSFWTLPPDRQLVVGRDDRGADVVLSDVTVSKRHALLRASKTGAIQVNDLGSTNGTAVCGVRVTQETPIQPGDDLEIGGVLLRLELLSPDELRHLRRVSERLAEAGSDPLTRLRTRRFMTDELPQMVLHCRKTNIPLSCTFLDLDRFKAINDIYGHHVGDEVLARTSRIILGDVRDEDACVRYGGEEIILFLPGSSLLAATGVADRLRRKIANHDWYRTAPDLRVTASMGIAQIRQGEDTEAWIHRADQAMYRAKSAGRNRVCRAD